MFLYLMEISWHTARFSWTVFILKRLPLGAAQDVATFVRMRFTRWKQWTSHKSSHMIIINKIAELI